MRRRPGFGIGDLGFGEEPQACVTLHLPTHQAAGRRGCEFFNLSARPRMAGHESVMQVTDSCEHVRACTGRAMEENRGKGFSPQARRAFLRASPACPLRRIPNLESRIPSPAGAQA